MHLLRPLVSVLGYRYVIVFSDLTHSNSIKNDSDFLTAYGLNVYFNLSSASQSSLTNEFH